MRLRRLQITNYGCFDTADLALAAEPGRITLVVAANGAGKSVLRQAFHDLLFEIPRQSPMKFRFGYPGMALAAEALAADGTPFGFGCTRDPKAPRTTTDPARFEAILRDTTPKQIESLFALDTLRLRKGGADLQGGDTLAAAMLSGTGELASATKIRSELEARKQANYVSNRRSLPLNMALGALKDARKRARDTVHPPAKRARDEDAAAAADAEYKRLEELHRAHLAELRTLARIGQLRPHFAGLAEAEGWFAQHPDAPALPEGLATELADARGRVSLCQAKLEALQHRLQAEEREYAGLIVDTPALGAEAELAALPDVLGQAKLARTELPLRRADFAAATVQVVGILNAIGASLLPAEAASLLPSVALTAASRDAITKYDGLVNAHKTALRRSQEAARTVAELERSPPVASIAAPELETLVRDIRADRANPAQHASECAHSVREAEADRDAALAKVPGWRQSADALRALTPDDEDSYTRLDTAQQQAEQEVLKREADRDETARRRDETRQTLMRLRTDKLPDREALLSARAARDGGWVLIARRLAHDPDEAAERTYAGDAPLALAFEQAIRAADGVADRRMDEVSRLEKADLLTQELAELDRTWEAQEETHAKAVDVLEQARQRWIAAVAPLGLAPDTTLAELRRVLTARTDVLTALHALQRANGKNAWVQAQQAAWAAALADLLRVPDAALPPLLAAADARLEQASASGQAVAAWTKDVRAARKTQERAGDECATAGSDLAEWEVGWANILQRLGRPPDERPPATAAVLEQLTQLGTWVAKADGFALRIGEMEASLGGFDARVAALAATLGHAPSGDAVQDAEMLVQRRAAAIQGHSVRAQAASTLAESQKQHKTARDQAITAADELHAVVAKAGAADEAEAERRIAAAAEQARHVAMRDAAQAGVRQHGEGLPLAALMAESDATPDLGSARDAAEAAAQSVQEQLKGAAILQDQLHKALADSATATDATTAAAEQEAAAVHYGRLLEYQLELHLAGTMLRQAMDTMEEDGGALSALSDLFGQLTDGAYHLVLDPETGTTLHAIEHRYPKEEKTLHELSEGTRDQLYLALRIMALREHAAAKAPLPFIADDILQTFDDRRAGAALRVLLELSQQVQVIVLTHHEHLVHLAGHLPDSSVNLVRL